MPGANRLNISSENYGPVYDMRAEAAEFVPELQPPGSIRVEAPFKNGDPYRTFLSPEQSVCWHTNELLTSLQDPGVRNAGIVAKLKAYIPLNGTYLPTTSEVSTQSLQALMATAKIVKESKTTFIGHGYKNIAAATAGMRYNPKIAENAGYTPSEILNFIMNERKRAIVAGSEAFFRDEPEGEGLSLLPPERDANNDTIKITLAALVYSRADETINPRVIDRNTIEAIAHGEEYVLGWLGLDSDGWLTIAGNAILSEHDGNRLPCLTVDTLAQPRENNEYALAAMRNNRLARFVLDIISSGQYTPADQQAHTSYEYRRHEPTEEHYGTEAGLHMRTEPELEETTAELDMTELLKAGATPETEEPLIPGSVNLEDYAPDRHPSRRRPVTIITAPPFRET